MRIWLATSEVGNKSHKIEQIMCEENKGAPSEKLDVIDMNRKRLRIKAVDKHCELQTKSMGAPICRWCRALVSFANEKGVSGVQKILRKEGIPPPVPIKYSRIYLFRNFVLIYIQCVWFGQTSSNNFQFWYIFAIVEGPWSNDTIDPMVWNLLQVIENFSTRPKCKRANRPHRLPTCFPQIGFKQPHLRAFDKYTWGQSPLFMT